MEKKPRGDSKLDYLPGTGTTDLRDGLLSGRFPTYDAALEWLDSEHGVSSSHAALSEFYRKSCAPVIKQRRSLAAIRAEAWGEAMEEDSSLDAGILERLKQIVFEVLETEKPKPKDVKALVDSVVKLTSDKRSDRQIDLDERKVALLETKAKQNDEAKGVLNSTLSVEEQNRRLKEILK